MCIRNGLELDYCFRECIESILPVCDEVVVCDGQSTDGTQECIRDWMRKEPRIKLCVYPWKNPKGDITFFTDWINHAREHLTSDWHIQMDADEVLCDSGHTYLHQFLKEEHSPVSLWCNRLNFWKDTQHLIPHGVCLSHRVVRVAPTSVWMPSDGPDPRGAEIIKMAINSPLVIGHYGFLRKRDAYFAKSRALHGYFFDTYDPRLEQAEASQGNWMDNIQGVEWKSRLLHYDGPHPTVIHKWLRERGYDN